MIRCLAGIALGAMLASSAAAQCFEPSFGPLLGYGDDGPLQPLRAIGFPFPFAGTTWSHVHVNNNGMLYLTHGGASGGSPTGYSDAPATVIANLCGGPGQPPRIAPFWKDLQNLQGYGGGVFVDGSRADRCVITWQNAVEWGQTTPKTIQCQLFRSGVIEFWYSDDLQVEAGAVLVGISMGGGSVDPGPIDLAPGSASAPAAIVYQTFLASAAEFDLAGRTVAFTPNGSGGFVVTSMVCAPASHADFGVGCGGLARESFHVPVSPNSAAAPLTGSGLSLRRSAGGYSVEALQSSFLPPSGSAMALPLGDDGELSVPLGLPFPHPHGIATSLWVSANGIVSLQPQTGLLPNRWTPSPAGLLGAAQTAWFCWHDFAPSLAGSGAVRCEQRGSRFVITWDGVWDFGGSSPAAASTFQFQFDTSTGDVHLVFGTLSAQGSTDFLVGYSPGGGSLDPGPLDLATDLPRSLTQDRPSLSLQVAPNPVLGQNLVFVTENIPPQALLAMQIVSLGCIEPGLDLGGLGAPGCLQSVRVDGASFIPLLRPGNDFYAVTVPNDLRLIGWVIGSQSLALDLGSNALGLVTSNAVRSRLNTF